MKSKQLSHIDEQGRPAMVDVSGKPPQVRRARAMGRIRMHPDTVALIRNHRVAKGNVLTVAEIAGIQAAKRTAELIPLCHPLAVEQIEVRAVLEADAVRIECTVVYTGKTGVEMEALTAVSVALLTVYDMCKAADKAMVLGEIKLLEKIKS